MISVPITKTCLYNFDPLKPHFYIVKLVLTGVYIIFLISAQKHRFWVFVRTDEVVLMNTHNLCLEQKYEKYQSFLSEKFQLLEVNFPIYLNRRVFVMPRTDTSVKALTILPKYLNTSLNLHALFAMLRRHRRPKVPLLLYR